MAVDVNALPGETREVLLPIMRDGEVANVL
jgi:hypothetical protein